MQTNLYTEVIEVLTSTLVETFFSFFLNFWYFWLPIIGIAIFSLFKKLHRLKKIKKAGLFEIDKMSGTEFEIFLAQLFIKLGYKVEVTGRMADYGADLTIEKDNIKTAAQAKCWRSPVTVKAIQEVTAAKAHYNATEAMVITNNRFTSNARVLAKENHIRLVDREKLASVILQKKEIPYI